jgi:UDP-N-acetylmuramoyl-tripeptide--D-alanyl-D-alanine ligase
VPDEPLLEPYLTRSDIVVKRVDARSPLPFGTNYTSEHQLQNTRTAIVVAESLDIPLPETLHVEFSKLREEERPLPGDGVLLNDCYNANPVSMRAALEHFAARAGDRRRIAVLGDMLELGPSGPEYHREVRELVRELGIEHVIAVGELAREYDGDWVATAAEAAERLRAELRPGDAVLVKGSLGVGLAVVAENLGV